MASLPLDRVRVRVSFFSHHFLSPHTSVTEITRLFSQRTRMLSTALVVLAMFAATTAATYPLSTSSTPLASTATTLTLACKGCAELGWDRGNGSPDVCGQSVLPNGRCSGFLAFEAAANFCEANFGAGARLCTISELLNSETKETGCNYDLERVWSSTPCNNGMMQAFGDPDIDCEFFCLLLLLFVVVYTRICCCCCCVSLLFFFLICY